MPRNQKQNPDVIARRRKVAMFLLHGLNQEEIVESLPKGRDPIVNPKTGKPYSIGTINGDIQALLAEWKEHAAQDIETLKGKHPAEVREAKRAAAC
ncbi:MAG: hypothetical protein M3Q62_14615 [Actinomycetota bacterium]|jgi:hypothetical protein|nr:hypothetical protein [Rubrobacteraceae bacterium]MDQ3184731.1 hypothetical protein [Actinomycetota bacterium]